MTIKELLVQHCQAGLGILAANLFGQNTVIDYHYVFLVYADLCRERNTTVIYAERHLEVRRTTLQKWASQLHKKLVDSDILEQDVWFAAALSCVMRYINDDRLFFWDESPEIECVWNEHKVSVDLY